MGMFQDFYDGQFEADFPFGVPGDTWHSKDGDIPVANMSVTHIKNCMRVVGEDDPWYSYFTDELAKREIKEAEHFDECDTDIYHCPIIREKIMPGGTV